MNAQNINSSYFNEIPHTPENFSAGNIITRMIDGLGYRFYWASENLRSEDLTYQFTDEGRNCIETIQHIYELSITIKKVAEHEPNIRPYANEKMEYQELRVATLKNLWIARNLFSNKKESDMDNFSIVFQHGDKKSEFPLWNLLNGQLADAIYHTGQLVLFRRASGNPISSKVNVFTGKNAN